MSVLSPDQFGYHGTNAPLKPGDVIAPGKGEAVWKLPRAQDAAAYEAPVLPTDITTNERVEYKRYGVAKMAAEMAHGWAEIAASVHGGQPHVYRVKALGPASPDPNVPEGGARVAARLKVMNEVR